MKNILLGILLILYSTSSCNVDDDLGSDTTSLKEVLQGKWNYDVCCYKDGELIIDGNTWHAEFSWYNQYPPDRPPLCPGTDILKQINIIQNCTISYISRDEIHTNSCSEDYSNTCGENNSYTIDSQTYKVVINSDSTIVLETDTSQDIYLSRE